MLASALMHAHMRDWTVIFIGVFSFFIFVCLYVCPCVRNCLTAGIFECIWLCLCFVLDVLLINSDSFTTSSFTSPAVVCQGLRAMHVSTLREPDQPPPRPWETAAAGREHLRTRSS